MYIYSTVCKDAILMTCSTLVTGIFESNLLKNLTALFSYPSSRPFGFFSCEATQQNNYLIKTIVKMEQKIITNYCMSEIQIRYKSDHNASNISRKNTKCAVIT